MSNTSKKLEHKSEQLLQSIAKETDIEVCKKLILKVLPLNPEPWRLILAIPVCDEIISFTHDELLIKDGSKDYEIFLLAMKDKNKMADFQISDTKKLELVLYILAKFGYTQTLEKIPTEVIEHTLSIKNSCHIIDLARYGQIKPLQSLFGTCLDDINLGAAVAQLNYLSVAIDKGYDHCAEFFFDAICIQFRQLGLIFNEDEQYLLHFVLFGATIEDNSIVIEYLITKKGVNPNYLCKKPNYSGSVLSLALNEGKLESMSALLIHGASLPLALNRLIDASAKLNNLVSLCFYSWILGHVSIDELVKINNSFYIKDKESGLERNIKPNISSGLEKLIAVLEKFYCTSFGDKPHEAKSRNNINNLSPSSADFTVLPPEILSLICHQVDEPSMTRRVNKTMWRIVDDYFWKVIFNRHFGLKVNIKLPNQACDDKQFIQLNYLRLFKFFSNYHVLSSFMSHVIKSKNDNDWGGFQSPVWSKIKDIYALLCGPSDTNNNFYLQIIPHAITHSIASLDIKIFRALAFFVDINKLAEHIVQHSTMLEAKDTNWLFDHLSNIGLKLTPELLRATFKYCNLGVLKWIVKHLDKDLDAIKRLYEQDCDEIEFIPYELMSNALRSQLKSEAKINYLQFLIIELGFYPHIVNANGINLLFDASPEEPMTMRYLLSWGLNPNQRENIDGRTALIEQGCKIQLHRLSNDHSSRVILELLAGGANPYQKDHAGMTVYQYVNRSYTDGSALIGLITGELAFDKCFLACIVGSDAIKRLMLRALDLLVGAIINGGRFYQRDGFNILISLRQNSKLNKLPTIHRTVLFNKFFDSLKKHITQMLICIPDMPNKHQVIGCCFNVIAGFIRSEVTERAPFGNNDSKFLKTLCHAILIRYAIRVDHIRQILKLLQENYGINFSVKSLSRSTLFQPIRNSKPKLPLDIKFLLIMSQVTLNVIIKSQKVTVTDDDLSLKALINFSYDTEYWGIDEILNSIQHGLKIANQTQVSTMGKEIDHLWHKMLLMLAKNHQDLDLVTNIRGIIQHADNSKESGERKFNFN